MIKMTSLTGLELRIIKFFLTHMNEQFAIREISRETKIDYKLIHLTVQKLAQKNVLLKKRQANIDLCSLNLKGDITPIYFAEMLRAKEFLNKHSELKLFFEDIKKNTRTMFYSLVIFGSFAKGTETNHSDIDLLVITTTKATGEEIERVISSAASFLKRKVQTILLDEKEFKSSLKEKNITVATEAFKNHLIISGVEAFYQGVNQ